MMRGIVVVALTFALTVVLLSDSEAKKPTTAEPEGPEGDPSTVESELLTTHAVRTAVQPTQAPAPEPTTKKSGDVSKLSSGHHVTATAPHGGKKTSKSLAKRKLRIRKADKQTLSDKLTDRRISAQTKSDIQQGKMKRTD